VTIEALSAFPGLGTLPGLTGLGGTAGTPADTAATGFADALVRALDGVSQAHNELDELSIKAATGDLAAVHDYSIAATEAQLLTQLTVEVRNRAVEAFNDIMRMQV